MNEERDEKELLGCSLFSGDLIDHFKNEHCRDFDCSYALSEDLCSQFKECTFDQNKGGTYMHIIRRIAFFFFLIYSTTMLIACKNKPKSLLETLKGHVENLKNAKSG